jgi:hypothetical protein
MSDSLAASFYPAYPGFNPPIEADDGVIPSYVPRAEVTFPAFAALEESPPTRSNDANALFPFPRPMQAAGGGAFGGMGDMQQGGMQQGGEAGGDQFGFGSTPFIKNTDSDNVFDSIGNIFTDGGDTSDWIDIGYNVARMFGGFAEGGLVEQEPAAFAGGGVVALEGGGKVAIGPGGGLDDLIPTSIDGRRAAALSDGEFVIPADVVSMMGDGSSNAGARRLYDLVKQVRDNKTGTTRQAGPLPVGDILKRSLG